MLVCEIEVKTTVLWSDDFVQQTTLIAIDYHAYEFVNVLIVVLNTRDDAGNSKEKGGNANRQS
jgi:hypothetical protein